MTVVERLLKRGKGPAVEFARLPDDFTPIAEHVVALLNGGGGYVLLGVAEGGRVIGVPDGERVAADLRRFLADHISPRAFLDVGVDPVRVRRVVVVDVPAGKDTPFVTRDRVFVRRGSATREASGDDIHSVLQRRAAEVERWERRSSPTLTEDDLDREEIDVTIRSSRDHGGATPRLDGGAYAALSVLGMTSQGQLTNAADVAFGLNPALRHPQVRVRLFAFHTDRGGDFADHRTLSGPICAVVEQAAAFILDRAPTASEFPANRLQRRDLVAYPHWVLREGLVNALAHRDYASSAGGVTIEAYPGRVEIWNAGRLPEGWDARRLRTTHPSLPTNPDIAQVLYLRGFMERIGRGTLKMIQTCREDGIPAPRWEVDPDGIRLTIFSRASRSAASPTLNDRQRALLASLETGEALTLPDYHAGIGVRVSLRQARRDLSGLVEAGFLLRDGRGPATHYRRTNRELK